jgi:hypothetical protein
LTPVQCYAKLPRNRKLSINSSFSL